MQKLILRSNWSTIKDEINSNIKNNNKFKNKHLFLFHVMHGMRVSMKKLENIHSHLLCAHWLNWMINMDLIMKFSTNAMTQITEFECSICACILNEWIEILEYHLSFFFCFITNYSTIFVYDIWLPSMDLLYATHRLFLV